MGEMPTPNGSNERLGDEFTIKDVAVENMRPLRVIVVGAGFSGILAAIRIPERLRNVELVVYEKSERVGGVWWLNKYPGVACDIPSHSYQYSFAPNPNWSNLYAPGSEIQQYLEDVAERFGAMRFIKTRHQVEHCAWDDVSKKWNVRVTNLATGEAIEDSANVLVTARGQLNDMSWPDIPGLGTFQGKLMHSGDWDTSYDFRNKRIGIIGNGSSAIQIIPSLQKVEGAQLTCFMRSPTWISSAFGDQGMIELGMDPANTASPPPFAVLGRGGLPLAERWAGRAESYLSVAVDGFPNMLIMFGPNSAIGFGSLTRILEAEADYILAVLRKLQREDYASAEPRPERVRDFMEYVDAYFRDTVYMDDCRSWYRRGDKVVGLWPGSTLHALEALRAPRWEDWVYEPVDDAGRRNGLRWLGNGRSVTQVEGDPSWYINPDEVQVPLEGRPEENARFKARPWCY
ncbi:FAD/NAD(P)-binding domain-containing protein [Thermothelomyces heterothallicus CBS 203.75]